MGYEIVFRDINFITSRHQLKEKSEIIALIRFRFQFWTLEQHASTYSRIEKQRSSVQNNLGLVISCFMRTSASEVRELLCIEHININNLLYCYKIL